MQDWSQPGAGRAADTEAERDPAGTVPDPPDRPDPPDPAAAAEDSTEWDELTPAGTGQVTPPADVLVAGRPIGTPPPPGGPPYAGGPAERPVTPPVTPTLATTPTAETAGATSRAAPAPEPAQSGTVIESGAADGFHARWRDVQFGFVDDPRTAVRQADELADEVVRAFTEALGARRRALEDRWRSQGDAPPGDTERLRLIVRAYRELVDRLLTT